MSRPIDKSMLCICKACNFLVLAANDVHAHSLVISHQQEALRDEGQRFIEHIVYCFPAEDVRLKLTELPQ